MLLVGRGASAVVCDNRITAHAKASCLRDPCSRLACRAMIIYCLPPPPPSSSHTQAGVQLSDGAASVVQRNTVMRGKGSGIFVFGGARGRIEVRSQGFGLGHVWFRAGVAAMQS